MNRSAVLFSAACSLAGAFLHATQSPAAAAAYGYDPLQGQTYRANLLRTGSYDAPGVPKFTKVAWSADLGGKVISSPVVHEGRVYVGSGTGVHCLDADSGKSLWKFETAKPVYASPTLYHGMVYVNAEDGNLYALDAKSGTEVWKQPLPGRAGSLMTSPAAAYGIVFANHGGKARFDEHNWGGSPVLGFDAKTGEKLFEQFDGKGPQGLGAIALTRELMVFGNKYGGTYDLATGKRTPWKYPQQVNNFDSNAHTYQPPAISDNVVVEPGQRAGDHSGNSPIGNIRAIDLQTGRPLWDVLATTDFDPKTKKPVDGRDHSVNGAVCVADGVAFWGSMSGKMFANSITNNGGAVWTADLGAPVRSPSHASGRIYVGLDSGELAALEASSGKLLWKQKISPAPLISSPVVDGSSIYIGSNDGSLYRIQ